MQREQIVAHLHRKALKDRLRVLGQGCLPAPGAAAPPRGALVRKALPAKLHFRIIPFKKHKGDGADAASALHRA